MLISILTDKTLMSNTNFVEGYNVLFGDVDINNPCNQKYGNEHTGDAWLSARDRFCANPHGPTMPVGLIVFGDKSHTDLNGTLALDWFPSCGVQYSTVLYEKLFWVVSNLYLYNTYHVRKNGTSVSKYQLSPPNLRAFF